VEALISGGDSDVCAEIRAGVQSHHCHTDRFTIELLMQERREVQVLTSARTGKAAAGCRGYDGESGARRGGQEAAGRAGDRGHVGGTQRKTQIQGLLNTLNSMAFVFYALCTVDCSATPRACIIVWGH